MSGTSVHVMILFKILTTFLHLFLDSSVIKIRLTGSKLYNEGQVEVYNGQNWGKVCANFWQFQDAQVACRQLGFADTQLRNQCCGTSNMQINIGNISCTGSEPNLANCNQNNAANQLSQCSTTMSAQAFCVGKTKMNSTVVNLMLL